MGDVTRVLSAIESGDSTAAGNLLPLVYDELRRLAAARMAQESPDHTLQATALVHEAWVRLGDVEQARHWDSRGHFFAAAAEAMRRILVDVARRKQAVRRGANHNHVRLDDVNIVVEKQQLDVLALDEVLTEFEACEPDKAALVKLRFFAGLTMEEVAAAQSISIATANRHWVYARAWLLARIGPSDEFPAT
ncbi:MAG: ECF-type sigma factor [Planctomycetaceae bacterium]